MTVIDKDFKLVQSDTVISESCDVRMRPSARYNGDTLAVVWENHQGFAVQR